MDQDSIPLSASQAREQFSDVLNRAVYKQERVLIERQGKAVAAVISLDQLRHFERLEQEAEDRRDVADALAARDEAERVGTTPLETFVTDLGL